MCTQRWCPLPPPSNRCNDPMATSAPFHQTGTTITVPAPGPPIPPPSNRHHIHTPSIEWVWCPNGHPSPSASNRHDTHLLESSNSRSTPELPELWVLDGTLALAYVLRPCVILVPYFGEVRGRLGKGQVRRRGVTQVNIQAEYLGVYILQRNIALITKVEWMSKMGNGMYSNRRDESQSSAHSMEVSTKWN